MMISNKNCEGQFRNYLALCFKNKVLFEYSDKPMTQNTETRNKEAMDYRLKNKGIANNISCIQGHFLPIKYDNPKTNIYYMV